MGPGQNQQVTATSRSTLVTVEASQTTRANWETRLYPGLRMPRVPGETRATLANALGALGVEAEYFLLLLTSFPGTGRLSHTRAEIFLSQLEAAARRLYHTADALEIATQGYLTALELGYPEVRNDDADTDPWWPVLPDFELDGESIELRMRRCSYAYRHVVDVYLGANISAIASQMVLVLHALTILPPAGVLPASSLYQGLYDLSSMFQGHVIPHHIGDLDPHTPGLLTGIARLRRLDAQEETSLQSDLLWAQAQLNSVQKFLNVRDTSSAQHQWALRAANEWQQTIQLLTSLLS